MAKSKKLKRGRASKRRAGTLQSTETLPALSAEMSDAECQVFWDAHGFRVSLSNESDYLKLSHVPTGLTVPIKDPRKYENDRRRGEMMRLWFNNLPPKMRGGT
jgi:hypothetical protein